MKSNSLGALKSHIFCNPTWKSELLPKVSFGISKDVVCVFALVFSEWWVNEDPYSLPSCIWNIDILKGFKCQECIDRFNSLSATTKKCFLPDTHLEHEHPQSQKVWPRWPDCKIHKNDVENWQKKRDWPRDCRKWSGPIEAKSVTSSPPLTSSSLHGLNFNRRWTRQLFGNYYFYAV